MTRRMRYQYKLQQLHHHYQMMMMISKTAKRVKIKKVSEKYQLKEYFSKTTSLHEANEGSDKTNENLRYQDLLDSVEDDMGPPIDRGLAEVCWEI